MHSATMSSRAWRAAAQPMPIMGSSSEVVSTVGSHGLYECANHPLLCSGRGSNTDSSLCCAVPGRSDRARRAPASQIRSRGPPGIGDSMPQPTRVPVAITRSSKQPQGPHRPCAAEGGPGEAVVMNGPGLAGETSRARRRQAPAGGTEPRRRHRGQCPARAFVAGNRY